MGAAAFGSLPVFPRTLMLLRPPQNLYPPPPHVFLPTLQAFHQNSCSVSKCTRLLRDIQQNCANRAAVATSHGRVRISKDFGLFTLWFVEPPDRPTD